MSRWIDADAIKGKAWKAESEACFYALEDVVSVTDIDEAPSIDIVRCKECKHWHELIDAKGQGRCDADEHNPFRVSIGISTADFYCSYGERKESE